MMVMVMVMVMVFRMQPVANIHNFCSRVIHAISRPALAEIARGAK